MEDKREKLTDNDLDQVSGGIRSVGVDSNSLRQKTIDIYKQEMMDIMKQHKERDTARKRRNQ